MRWYPQLAKSGDISLIYNPDYLLEEKLDGIRCLAYVGKDAILLKSRTGKTLDTSFPDVLESMKGMVGIYDGAIFDGEIVPTISGYTFQNLQTRLQRITNVEQAIAMCPVKYVVFDMLHGPGSVSMLDAPLTERRATARILANSAKIDFSQEITTAQATEILDDHKREGVIAKIKTGTYNPGQRTNAWLKIKSMRTVEAIIGGCTFGVGRRQLEAGSLLLGEETVDGLHYIGNVGTGFTDDMLNQICILIETFRTEESPFLDFPNSYTDSQLVKTYCKPGKMRAVIAYQERTKGDMLRFPSFKSLKVDSEA